MSDTAVSPSIAPPTEWGFYQYDGGNQVMVFLLDTSNQWHVIFASGNSEKCEWEYIEQALTTYNLVPIKSKPKPDEHFEQMARDALKEITFEIFGTKLEVICDRDKKSEDGRLYYQVVCQRPDTYTGNIGEGRSGKAYLSEHMIWSELVQLAWGLLEGYVHHESREGFEYKGHKIYGPHMKVELLAAIADDIAVRP